MLGVVYKITNLVNGKIYIGQTTRSLKKRWKEHCSTRAKLYPIGFAIKKYGKENFEIKVITRCNSIEELNHREFYYIELFKSIDKKVGYNLKTGGNNAITSDETKKKLSDAKSGKKHPLFGKNHSEEAKKKISLANKGKKRSKEFKIKRSVSFYGKNNPFFGKTHTKETKNKISTALSGENGSFFGKTHTKEAKKKISDAQSKIKIFCPELNIEFESIEAAAKYTKAHSQNIGKVVSGKRKYAKGLTFIRIEKDVI